MSDTTSVPDDVYDFSAARIRALEAELEQTKQQMMQMQRLATVGTIASVIAHEFNNLLTPISSYCQMASHDLEAGKTDLTMVKKALSKSYTHAMKAGKICTSMLGLARGHSQHTTIALQTIVEEVLNVLARDPQKDGIALRVQVPANLKVHADPVQIEQVLLNLLINARHALLTHQIRGGSITVKADREADHVRLAVTDTGPGIDAAVIERIFDPFFTTKAHAGEHRGSGLGLSICHKIVTEHKGRIEVSSEPGRGASFRIYLPAA